MSRIKKICLIWYICLVMFAVAVIIEGVINNNVAGTKEYIIPVAMLLLMSLIVLIRSKF
ncbi:MAG: hypothetical protein QXH92_04715 [Candidatus Aenigmatarchaeota archaeon]